MLLGLDAAGDRSEGVGEGRYDTHPLREAAWRARQGPDRGRVSASVDRQ
ncbi:unnamed protein product [Linum tenue]|uniref:Uncharacterized protein n=1 Tax=Linum tenue TaxID=586396 RepID=A0AAV0J727_9ROSI|nr:unnamed protein product [Linum tenue]